MCMCMCVQTLNGNAVCLMKSKEFARAFQGLRAARQLVFMHTYIHAYIHIYTYIHTFTYMHTYILTYIHIHM